METEKNNLMENNLLEYVYFVSCSWNLSDHEHWYHMGKNFIYKKTNASQVYTAYIILMSVRAKGLLEILFEVLHS
jgi:hypothetical protein